MAIKRSASRSLNVSLATRSLNGDITCYSSGLVVDRLPLGGEQHSLPWFFLGVVLYLARCISLIALPVPIVALEELRAAIGIGLLDLWAGGESKGREGPAQPISA